MSNDDARIPAAQRRQLAQDIADQIEDRGYAVPGRGPNSLYGLKLPLGSVSTNDHIAAAQQCTTSATADKQWSTGKPVELTESGFIEEVSFPSGLSNSPIEVPSWYNQQKPAVKKELQNILTWANYLAFCIKKIDLGGLDEAHREQAYRGVIFELLQDLLRTAELKRIRVVDGSAFAAIIETQARPTYQNSPTIEKYYKAAKKRQYELELGRGSKDDTAEDKSGNKSKNSKSKSE